MEFIQNLHQISSILLMDACARTAS